MNNYITKKYILKNYSIKKSHLDICFAKRHLYKLDPFIKKGKNNCLLVEKNAFDKWMEDSYAIHF